MASRSKPRNTSALALSRTALILFCLLYAPALCNAKGGGGGRGGGGGGRGGGGGSRGGGSSGGGPRIPIIIKPGGGSDDSSSGDDGETSSGGGSYPYVPVYGGGGSSVVPRDSDIQEEEHKPSLTGGVIAGIVVGTLTGFAAMIGFVVLIRCLRSRRRKLAEAANEEISV
ncbi:hypothetical protein DFQ27_009721 [Actinomortierella ambigua]|uniref:Uncharacterized protein n=1 Tax=Actinomortierella ambigua TaxID=1343610 RepID=A0A9P6TWT1_9FUNG|nr:hypothetical protein DFQ27_009721 [Actinomortierella ambigua]